MQDDCNKKLQLLTVWEQSLCKWCMTALACQMLSPTMMTTLHCVCTTYNWSCIRLPHCYPNSLFRNQHYRESNRKNNHIVPRNLKSCTQWVYVLQNKKIKTPCYGGSTNNNHNGTQMNSQEGMGAWFCMFSPFGHRVLWECCANGVPIVEAKNTLYSLFLFSSFNGVWPIFRSLTSFPSPFLLICPLSPLIGIPAWASMVRETLGTVV